MKSVLIIDDNKDFADTLAVLLQLKGVATQVAYTPVTGINVAEQMQPDIIVLDIGLPVIDGYAVARQLRRNSSLRKTVLIAVTGHATEDDRQRALANGFDLHCKKPLNRGDLRRILETAHRTEPLSAK